MSKQFNRQRRHNNLSARPAPQQITRFTNLDSSGPLGKLRGTPLQLAEKYQAGAKDAQTQGDDVLFQTCLQYADHYLRLQAIALENEQMKQEKRTAVIEKEESSENTSVTEKEESEKTKKDSNESSDASEKKSE